MNINLENQKSLSKLLDDENEIIKYGQSIIESNKNQSQISIIKEFNLNGQDKNISLFGIFDGHNGPEVSKYLSLHFSQFLSENINFTNGNYKKSLEEIFINIDDSLRALQVQLELSNYSIKKDIKKDSNNNEFEAFLELFEPRNLDKINIAEFCGSSGIVILITEKTAFIANLGNSKCIPINNKNEIIKEKN
jgi:protein phosphatase 1G